MNKTVPISFLIILNVLLSVNVLLADTRNVHSPRAKERMDLVKKMKMVEIMELDEVKSEKFLIKFNAYSKRIEDNRKQHRELVDKLNEAVKNNSNGIAILSEQVLNLQEEFNKINSEKTYELKSILSETEFAKYLVFENKFIKEVFDCFMNHNKDMNDRKKTPIPPSKKFKD